MFCTIFADWARCLSTKNTVAASFSLVKKITCKASGLLSDTGLPVAICFLTITHMRSNTDPGNLGVINPSFFNFLYPTTSLEGH